MKTLEPKLVNVDETSRKIIQDYCYELFRTFQTGNEAVCGSINGVQILIFV